MRINSNYSTLTHQPLVLLRQDISYSQFLALMNMAEIFIVSSLREGMNLTSHDYVRCQDGKLGPHRHGSLILSEFAGSASIFNGHELMINPWDYREVADTINKALEMSPEQKRRNWEFLLNRMAPHTAVPWCNSLQESLVKAHRAQVSREPDHVSSLSINALKGSYENSNLRLIFVEDEGTFSQANSKSNKEPASLLEPLVDDPKNLVYVTSNKSPEQLEPLARMLPSRVGYIAENGCFKRDIGLGHWETLVNVEKTKEWRKGVRKVIDYFQERTDGSQIEEQRCLLTFRYSDASDPEIAARQASELADQINGSRGSEAIRVVLTDRAVSVEPLDVTKAKAAASILQRLPQAPEFLFAAGGSRGDEALFRFANRLRAENKIPNVTTLTVGYHATEAKAVLPGNMGIADIVNVLSSPKMDGYLGVDGEIHV